jgi:hypothetical protein
MPSINPGPIQFTTEVAANLLFGVQVRKGKEEPSTD